MINNEITCIENYCYKFKNIISYNGYNDEKYVFDSDEYSNKNYML